MKEEDYPDTGEYDPSNGVLTLAGISAHRREGRRQSGTKAEAGAATIDGSLPSFQLY
jgi:hypothetical protein